MTITADVPATPGGDSAPHPGGSQSSPPGMGSATAGAERGSQRSPAFARPAAPASWALGDEDAAALYALWHEASARAMTVSVEARDGLNGWALVAGNGSKVEYRAADELGDGLLWIFDATGRGMGETLAATVNTHRAAAAMVAWFLGWPELRPRSLRRPDAPTGRRA